MLDSESNLSKVHREVGSKLSRNPRVMLANKKAVKAYYKAGRNEDDAAFKKAYENFQTVSQRKAIKFANKYADAYVKDFGLNDAYVKRGERVVAQKNNNGRIFRNSYVDFNKFESLERFAWN